MSRAESEDPGGITELATESVAPIEAELRQRLVLEVGEQDLLAIETALLKAFLNGMRAAAAAAESFDPLLDQHGAPTGFAPSPMGNIGSLGAPLPWLDPWAARYGGGGQ